MKIVAAVSLALGALVLLNAWRGVRPSRTRAARRVVCAGTDVPEETKELIKALTRHFQVL